MIEISLEESESELFDGFPEYIMFKTSIPATVYYTLDGKIPDETSLIAVDEVFLPTLSGTLSVKAIAISGDETSSVFETEYINESSDFAPRRSSDGEGVVVIRDDDLPEVSLGYLADGSAAQSMSEPAVKFDIKASSTDYLGNKIEKGKTSRDFINFAQKHVTSESKSITTVNLPTFDASAKFIIIDGSSEEAKKNQVVKIVNRPYNNFGPTTNFYKERLGEKEPIITGNHVRSFYNPKTKKYVSYYWESLESRWIRSEQFLDNKPLSVSGSFRNRFVYRWIQDRALSQLF